MTCSLPDAPAHLQVPQHLWFRLVLLDWAADVIEYGSAPRGLIHRVHELRWPTRAEKEWRWVYVARNRERGIVKVGLSSSPLKRIAVLHHEYKHGSIYDPVALLPHCSYAHEQAICKLLSPYVEVGNEWFRDCVATRIFCWRVASKRDPREANMAARWARPSRSAA